MNMLQTVEIEQYIIVALKKYSCVDSPDIVKFRKEKFTFHEDLITKCTPDFIFIYNQSNIKYTVSVLIFLFYS